MKIYKTQEEIQKCNSCGQPMFEIGEINKPVEIGEYRKSEGSEISVWHQTGLREVKLYQCPECKDVKIY